MRISARNQLKGKIVAIEHGVTTTHAKIGSGHAVTAAITKTSADELGLAVGKTATAIVKACDVMAGVD